MQITENDRQYLNGLPPAGDTPLTVDEYADINYEIEDQPAWRAVADKEMDYADGNQLDTELLRRQQALGIPPAVEDLIGPALLSLQGYEAVTRTDWRVTPNGDVGGQEVADALNYRLNTATNWRRLRLPWIRGLTRRSSETSARKRWPQASRS
ncbi:TPA: hypothetical protein ACKQLR_003287 [Pseudomonas aeruginosa]